jgi:hypothetical protein
MPMQLWVMVLRVKQMIPFDEPASLGAPRLLSRTDLIVVILRLQFEGWQIALTDGGLHAGEDENFMNGRLFQGMVAVRRQLGLTNLFLVEQPAVRVNQAARRPESEPDVILLFSEFGANEPHAVVECKRLDPVEVPKNLRGEYVRSGIDRFVSGFYGPGHDLDFMVAYVLRGAAIDAMIDVNEHLANVARVSDQLAEERQLSAHGFVASSNHRRTNGQADIRLLHSYMLFPNERRHA